MSAWYMFNAMGFYPMNPASGEYVVGSPIFDRVDIQLPTSDHLLTIKAQDAKDKPYVKNLFKDGVATSSPIISHVDLLKTEVLYFEMNTVPQTWGASAL